MPAHSLGVLLYADRCCCWDRCGRLMGRCWGRWSLGGIGGGRGMHEARNASLCARWCAAQSRVSHLLCLHVCMCVCVCVCRLSISSRRPLLLAEGVLSLLSLLHDWATNPTRHPLADTSTQAAHSRSSKRNLLSARGWRKGGKGAGTCNSDLVKVNEWPEERGRPSWPHGPRRPAR